MKTTVQKWGNSLGVRIPKKLAEDANIKDGTSVEVTFRDGQILIESREPNFDLKHLVDGISESNRHEEIETGESVGKEVW